MNSNLVLSRKTKNVLGILNLLASLVLIINFFNRFLTTTLMIFLIIYVIIYFCLTFFTKILRK